MTSLEAPGPTRLGPESNGLLMKPEEFIAIEEWDRAYRYELVNGVVIVNAAPGPGERSPNDTLGFWLRLYQQNDPQGKVIDDTLPEQYIQTFRGWRRMDRAVWIGLGRAPQIEVDVSAIAIEFVSGRLRDRRRDYVDNRQEYAEAGVKEYWIVDRARRQFVCFRGPDEEIVLSDGVYRTGLMPGFELSIPALMAAAAKYD